MNDERATDLTLIEQVRIQARILVPLVKALQAELGEERANAIVLKAMGPLFRKYGEKWWQSQGARSFEEKMDATFGKLYGAADALKYDVIRKTPDAFDVNVTECQYAQFYNKIGVPELGFLLTCSADFDHAEGFGADVKLTRTQTIMQGASHCNFRYRVEEKKKT